MKFSYAAIGPENKVVNDVVDANSEREARALLKSKGVKLLMISKKKQSKLSGNVSFGHVKKVDLLFFVKHLNVMLKSGISVFESLHMLADQAKGALQAKLKAVLKDVAAGTKLADGLAKHPKDFPELIVELVRSGEMSGTLEANLQYIAAFIRKDIDLRKKVKSALMYPMFVLVAIIGLTMAIGLFVLPQILPLFDSLDVDLPTSTKVLLWFAHYFQDYGLQTLIGLIAAGIFIPIFLELKFIRPISHRIYLRLPVAGPIIVQLNLARFFRVFATLMEAGVPIDKTLDVCKNVIRNVNYKKAILHMKRSVEQGTDISDSVKDQELLFPTLVNHMMKVGERTGNLSDSLIYISEFYEEEVDEKMKNLSTALEPILLIGIGLIVAGVAFSIIGPIYSLSGGIR